MLLAAAAVTDTVPEMMTLVGAQWTAARPWLQRTMATVATVTVAWFAGSLISPTDGVIAAVIAAITIRLSVHSSVAEGLVQFGGAVVGVAVSLASVMLFGNGVATVAVVVAAALIVARLLRLGDGGAAAVVVTALIVVGPGLAADTAGHRLAGTAIGVVAAFLGAFFMHPDTPLGRAQTALAALARDAGELLNRVAAAVPGGYYLSSAVQWRNEAAAFTPRLDDIRDQVNEAVRYARWSPLASRTDAAALAAWFDSMESTTVQIHALCSTLVEQATVPVAAPVVDALVAAGDSVHAAADAVAATVDTPVDPDTLEQLRDSVDDATRVVRSVDDTAELLLNAALVANVAHIAGALEPPPVDDNPSRSRPPRRRRRR